MTMNPDLGWAIAIFVTVICWSRGWYLIGQSRGERKGRDGETDRRTREKGYEYDRGYKEGQIGMRRRAELAIKAIEVGGS